MSEGNETMKTRARVRAEAGPPKYLRTNTHVRASEMNPKDRRKQLAKLRKAKDPSYGKWKPTGQRPGRPSGMG